MINRYVKALLGLVLTAAIIYLGNNRIGSLPPICKFVDPFHGFWQNAEFSEDTINKLDFRSDALQGEVNLVIEKRGVVHIFAENDHDLYFAQGYLTARERLWQMEFQTHAAAGRVSELVGKKALDHDLEQRRIGMVWAAERALEHISNDSVSLSVLDAYTDGINYFIEGLNENSLPLEYKLLNYKPEKWTHLKSALLLKYMAKMLTGSERDRPNTEALKLLGTDLFNLLYPEQNYLSDPVVPDFHPDTSLILGKQTDAFLSEASWTMKDIQPHFVGSNNWAVSGSRTESGSAILCNDPHLRLSLPSIWYEIQLHAPGINCYGISLPGAPNVIIGFNDSIAWGITNSGRDVKDYYSMEFRGGGNAEYKFGNKWRPATYRVEEIKVRGEESVFDTVVYTHLGPISYSNQESDSHLALRWTAHDPSNEMLAFYKMNKASGYDEFAKALSYYDCPGQNFAYADVGNNIALWQQGKFPKKPKDHGRFILDGNNPENEISEYIPQSHNPHMLNPERGFVSSANQAATDTSYPYYYTGVFEEFRNRTINDSLRADSSVSVSEMMRLQQSNYNLLAAEALPIMLELLDTAKFANSEYETLALNELKAWNYQNDKGIIAPTVFEIWWDELNNMLWDEFNGMEWDQDMYYRYSWEELYKSGKAKVDMRDSRYVYPQAKVTISLLENNPGHMIFDHRFSNDKKETAKDVIYDSFYWTAMKFGDIIDYQFNKPHWGHYQATKVSHLMRLDALGSKTLFVGGNENAPNATTSTHGPSWRMIVELNPDGPKAWGVLPGGQSGNPGSENYLSSLEKWTKGEYHELNFLNISDLDDEQWETITINTSEE